MRDAEDAEDAEEIEVVGDEITAAAGPSTGQGSCSALETLHTGIPPA